MITVLKKGTANKRMAVYGHCKYCDSELRIIRPEGSDFREPYDRVCWNDDYVTFTCPVCNERLTFYWCSSYATKQNATRKEITLTSDEMKELRG